MPILFGLISIIVSLGAVGCGGKALGKLLDGRDPALRLGLSGAFGLAFLGFITLPIGLIPNGLRWGVGVIGLVTLMGLYWLYKSSRVYVFKRAEGAEFGFVAALGAMALVAFLCACGPSDSFDWDSLAYHLAAPKVWNHLGQIQNLLWVHQSNFPFIVDNLFIWGLQWGGQAGAKAFMAAYLVFGILSAFGFARGEWGARAGFWAALAFAGMPVVLWESGTAYVDVPHGLFAGMGLLLLGKWLADDSDKGALWIGSLALGCAAASKYTGLQAVIAACLVIFIWKLVSKQTASAFRGAYVVGIVSLAIASPWLAKNVAWYGNPVYPFFYEKLGGQNWDAFAATIYRNEQQTFGIGRTESGRDLTQFGHGVLGLAYQPGRFVNPGQTQGMGFPTGALGFAALAGGLVWLVSGRWRRSDLATFAMIGLLLAMWFVLSQQSRYLVIVGFPLAVFAGAAASRLKLGTFVAAAIGLQAAYTLYLVGTESLQPKLPVITGQLAQKEFEARRIGALAIAADDLNALPEDSRIALYDEVFGFLLDRPYFWANPGHSTVFDYSKLETGDGLAARFRELHFTHVFLNTRFWGPEGTKRWAEAAGLAGSPKPLEGAERAKRFDDLESRWQVLLAEAVASGQLRPINSYGPGILFEVVR